MVATFELLAIAKRPLKNHPLGLSSEILSGLQNLKVKEHMALYLCPNTHYLGFARNVWSEGLSLSQSSPFHAKNRTPFIRAAQLSLQTSLRSYVIAALQLEPISIARLITVFFHMLQAQHLTMPLKPCLNKWGIVVYLALLW